MGLFLEAEQRNVVADPVRLKQVFWNLLRNAIKFTPAGGRIELRSWNSARNGKPWLHIEVSDTGLGFAPASASQLFEPFEQRHQASERKGGLGLGLAICKGIVEMHNGRIAASSRGPGTGARFVIDLETTDAQVVHPALPMEHAASSLAKPRLLLVEDDEDTLQMLEEVLRFDGYDVHSVRSSTAALAFDLTEIDVLISDIGLPDGSGLDLMRQLRGHLKGLALSGYGTEADIRASRDAGFSTHLTKPVDIERLLAAIHEVNERR